MDLREAWKKLDEERLTKPVDGTIHVPAYSKHPVQRIIFSFQLGLGFIIVFEALFIWLFFSFTQPIVQVGMATVIVLYLIFFFLNVRTLRRLMAQNRLDRNLREAFQNIHSIVTKTLEFQRKISWGVFPLCVVAGFLLGLSIENDAATLITKPPIYITLIITMCIMTPLCYFLTKWMTKISYGRYLSQLEKLIEQTKE